MNISDTIIKDLLKERAELDETQLSKLVQTASQQKRPLQELVLKQSEVTDEQLAQWYGDFRNIPFVKLDPKKLILKL